MNKKLIISIIGGVIAWLAIIKHPWANEGDSPLRKLLSGNFNLFSTDMVSILGNKDVGTGQVFSFNENILRNWGSAILIIFVVWFINRKSLSLK